MNSCSYQALIEELDGQIDRLLKNQSENPSVQGDRLMSWLIYQIEILQKTYNKEEIS